MRWRTRDTCHSRVTVTKRENFFKSPRFSRSLWYHNLFNLTWLGVGIFEFLGPAGLGTLEPHCAHSDQRRSKRAFRPPVPSG